MSKCGTLVLETLEEEEPMPVTIDNIVLNIAMKTEIEATNKLKHEVTNAVDGGVRLGFLKERRGKYMLENDAVDDGQMPSCSKTARCTGSRRQSASRSRSRSRSRTRSRRSRSRKRR